MMMQPVTLGSAVFSAIEENKYLQDIYESILFNYTNRIQKLGLAEREFDLQDALQFADLLSKSTGTENSDKHKIWAQEIISILQFLYPENPQVAYFRGSVLDSVANYRGLELYKTDYNSVSALDRVYTEYAKDKLKIPGMDGFFFIDQKKALDSMDLPCFSYSGPTSIGKSFVFQQFMKQKIESGENSEFAIIIPTKALINEVSKEVGQMHKVLQERNYRVVTSPGSNALKQQHHYIFRVNHKFCGMEYS